MRVVVLNGIEREHEEFARLPEVIANAISGKAFIEFIDLTTRDIRRCQGCFGCWVRTPGKCIVHDDSQQIRHAVINADIVVLLTPVVFGGYSGTLKKMIDKIIPLVLPFFTKYDGEIHHLPRYSKFPSFIGFGYSDTKRPDEFICFRQLVERNAVNVHCPHCESLVVLSSESNEDIQSKFNGVFNRVGGF
jgi:hypothetical protein